eukprot:gene785-75_t
MVSTTAHCQQNIFNHQFRCGCEVRDDGEFGIDWEGPPPNKEWDGPANEQVHVPGIVLPDHFHHAVEDINPLENSDFHGVDIYMRVLDRISNF